MRLNILALSYLFPNRARPNHGIFVLNRLKAMTESCNFKVIAPIQWYPLINYLLQRQNVRSSIPLRDEVDGIDVQYPRFFVIPRYFKWFDALSYLWVTRAVVNALRKNESFVFDLVDVHWTYPDIVAGYYLARTHRKKLIVTIRGLEALYPGEWTIRRWMLVYFLRKADFVVTLSDELRRLVIDLGIVPERVRTILNGVDVTTFAPLDKESCRQRLGLSKQRKIIISVGAIIERKGHHELIRIMSGLTRVVDVDLYIIGGHSRGSEGDFSAVIQKMVAKNSLSNVYIVDNKVSHKELALWYNAADLFCLISMGEGCPNVVLEALACGAPVVATNVGAIETFVKQGINGYLLPKDDLSSLEDIVSTAITRDWCRPEIASMMTAQGWSKCAEEVLDTYRMVLTSEQFQ